MYSIWFQIIYSILFGLITSIIAYNKGRSYVSWFFIGMIFPLSCLVLLFASTDGHKKQKDKAKSVQSKQTHVEKVDAAVVSTHSPSDIQQDTHSLQQIVSSSSATSDTWFYVSMQKLQVIGPVNIKELYELWKRDEINKESWVWAPCFSKWQRIIQVTDLHSHLDQESAL